MPGYRTFQSAGKISRHIIPGAYSRIDSVKSASGNLSVNNGVIIGKGYGLKPATLYQFNNSPDAMDAIVGGDLKEAVRLAFDPGEDLSPQKLFVMAVNTATQATLNLLDAATHPMIKLTSVGYGLYANQLNATVAAGTTLGKKLILAFRDASETFDNVYRAMLSIQYVGVEAACTLTIVNSSAAHTLAASVGGLSIADLSIYNTVEDLVAYIDSLADFTATVTSGSGSYSPLDLDAVTAVAIKASAVALEASVKEMIEAINENSALVTAEDISAANSLSPLTNVAAAYFASGSNGTYTATEWSAALLALEAEDVQYISTPDDTLAVASSIKAHCVAMSGASRRKERQFICGGAWGESTSTAKTAGQTLNSATGMFVHVGGKQYNISGILTNFGASYAACMLMAIKTSLAINMPLTFKKLNFVSLEKVLKDSDIEDLLDHGVAPLAYNSDGVPYLVRQITTYLTNDLKYNEFSMVSEMNYVSRDLRNYLQNIFVGNPGTKQLLDPLQGIVEARLRTYVQQGLFTEDSLGRTFWNVLIRKQGDQVFIDYDANITAPVNFMFITQHFSEAV